MSELKPCPFCGNTPKYESFRIPYDMGSPARIAKCKCGAWLNINRWNTRPLEDALRAENAKLREALDELVTCTANLKFHLSKDGNYSICKSDHTDMWMGETIVIGCALEDVDKAISQAQEALKNE